MLHSVFVMGHSLRCFRRSCRCVLARRIPLMSRECSDVLGAMALSRADTVRRDGERTGAGVVAVILLVASRVAAPSRMAFSTTSQRPIPETDGAR
jgi:hypothetical protein